MRLDGGISRARAMVVGIRGEPGTLMAAGRKFDHPSAVSRHPLPDTMASPKFAIPVEFADRLSFAPCSDTRTDAEILASLAEHHPVTSEKNIWAYWHAGLTSMPGWCKRNVVAWQRICGPEWTVRVLDSVPGSPNHALKFLSKDLLPKAFVDNAMDGEYSGPHSADLLRGACLHLHGGAFIDVGCILIRSLDRICWDQLSGPASPYQVAVPWMYGITVANHFVAALKGDPFIKRWHDLFVHLWRNKTNSQGLSADPLMAFSQTLTFDDSRASNYHWDFKVDAQTVFEYITQVGCWMRMCMLTKDEGDGFVGSEYWQKHVLIWDALSEAWAAEETLGFQGTGQRMFDLLSLPLSTNPESKDYKDAYHLVWRLLTRSAMQKVQHGKHLTNDVLLGVLWDENEGRDCEEGTFGELLRYGCVNFRQERKGMEYRDAPAPPGTLDKGSLEV